MYNGINKFNYQRGQTFSENTLCIYKPKPVEDNYL